MERPRMGRQVGNGGPALDTGPLECAGGGCERLRADRRADSLERVAVGGEAARVSRRQRLVDPGDEAWGRLEERRRDLAGEPVVAAAVLEQGRPEGLAIDIEIDARRRSTPVLLEQAEQLARPDRLGQ